jgi:EAL domain-containing protein (putative c-di-GMP-specific phosphodiesterase class I)
MSVVQLEDPDLITSMAGGPMPHGLTGLVVEVGESIVLPDNHIALESLKLLSRHGCQIAIDDFGSGFSSFRLLESLSPDYVKVDAHCLSDGHTPEAQATLMKSVVEFAGVIGSAVIAEEIETAEQWQRAQHAGVDFVQGNGVAPPMPLPLLVEWLGQHAHHASAPPT